MQPACLICECENGAVTPEGLCATCAREGSERSGLWQAGVWLHGRPATTPEDVRKALAALDWPTSEFGECDPDAGIWLLELPSLVGALLHLQGHICRAAGLTRVEVELP